MLQLKLQVTPTFGVKLIRIVFKQIKTVLNTLIIKNETGYYKD